MYNPYMPILQRHDFDESLTYANAPRIERDGKTYVEDDAAMALMMRIVAEEKELLDALAKQ